MLARVRPIGLIEGLAFEVLRSLPVAIGVLSRRLGWRRTLRAVISVVLQSMGKDPLKHTPRQRGVADLLVRRQLRSVLWLDTALRDGLGLPDDEAHDVLKDVVGATGAAFIDWTVPLAKHTNWVAASDEERRRYLSGLITRFPNATATPGAVGSNALSFEVTSCRFASLTKELGRPELGPLFCHADAVYFSQPTAPVELERSATLADGHSCCPFRFRFREEA